MKLSNPEVSVVMSVYNGAKYLRESVESILAQEGVDFEFIIVNDGSTDDSGNILAEYASQDDRISIIEQENTGLTRALIRSCEEANGKYIARQDADDISMPKRLLQLQELINSDEKIFFVSSWGQHIGPNGEILGIIERPTDPEEATRLMLDEKMGPPAHGSVMFSKDAYEIVGGYRRVFYYGQDSDLWLRLSQVGQIAYVPEILYCYRFWPANISSLHRNLQKIFGEIGQSCLLARRNNESEDQYLLMAKNLSDQIANNRIENRDYLQRVAETYYFIASSMEKRRNRDAFFYFWRAIKSYPLHVRAWIRLVFSSIKYLLRAR